MVLADAVECTLVAVVPLVEALRWLCSLGRYMHWQCTAPLAPSWALHTLRGAVWVMSGSLLGGSAALGHRIAAGWHVADTVESCIKRCIKPPLYRLYKTLYSRHALSRAHCRALQPIQHVTALQPIQLYSALQSTASTADL